MTGCAGFIGSHLVESLLGENVDVVGIDCFNDNYGRDQKLRNLDLARQWDSFEFIPIDLSRGGLDDLVADVDTVFHLAAEPGVRASWGQRFDAYLRNNVSATQHVLEAAMNNKDARIVYASSSSVYGHAETYPTDETALPQPYSPYGVTKLSAEHLTRLYGKNLGLSTVCLRYFSVYGPRQRPDMAFTRFCRAALTGETISVYGDGQQVRDFTYVDDVVKATRAAATGTDCVGGVYNVGGGGQVCLADSLQLLAEITGRELDVTYGPVVSGDVKRTSASIEKAGRDLAYAPQTDFQAGLGRQVEWMKSLLRIERGAVPV